MVKPLVLQERTKEEEEAQHKRIMDRLKEAAGGDGFVDSNFALAVFIQGLLLISAFGIEKEWLHGVVDIYFDETKPRIEASKLSTASTVMSPSIKE